MTYEEIWSHQLEIIFDMLLIKLIYSKIVSNRCLKCAIQWSIVAKFSFRNFSRWKQSSHSIDVFCQIRFRKFAKSTFDIREIFAADELTYKSLGKFGNYLREIQTLFSVSKISLFIRDTFPSIRIYSNRLHMVYWKP